MRVLVTGSGGQLGRELATALAEHDATLMDVEHLDVTDPAQVRDIVGSIRPEAIIHAAAWTDVDGCEGDPATAHRVNAEAAGNVAAAAGEAHVVYVSTDYVFDGAAERPYATDDDTNPIQVYGESKRAGELAVQAASRWAVARTAWLYGARIADGSPARNFVTAILGAARRGVLDVVTDQVGSPTCARDLAAGLVAMIEAGATGTFHVVNDGIASRYDLAVAAVTAAGLDPGLVRPIATADAPPRPARRPAYAPLAIDAWRAAGFDPLPGWEEALGSMMAELLEVV